MRIVRAQVTAVAAAFPKPLRFSERPMTTNTAVVAQLEDAEGPVGFGYLPTFGFGTGAVQRHVADDFAPRILRTELRSTQDAITIMAEAAAIAGRVAGSARQAMAVLEMALLDIEGQLAGKGLHELWGQPTQSVRAYASGGWRHLAVDELTRFAGDAVLEGFDAVKVQVGLSPDEDAARLRSVRDAIGPDVDLMLDANQRIPGDVATEWVAALAPFGPAWLEEPLPAAGHERLATLRRASTLRVAAGESETEPCELEDLLARRAVDVIQPDIHRIGLIATRAVRDRASIANVAVAPHMAHEVSAHVLSGMSGGGWLEYFDWFEDWWEEPVVPVSGEVTPPRTPGHGLRLRPGWLEAHTIR
jgi:L-alanine-DL-glutamate epimerase-like enolase superfamily enzyme